ncbi:hypothetical protein VNO77_40519 [Canavalia gladiata]|uniref:Uncharacterized protein n=1 Tax=Canavalia gladiata TaxID=3824 RepID=A0AAN9PRD6_CANGL
MMWYSHVVSLEFGEVATSLANIMHYYLWYNRGHDGIEIGLEVYNWHVLRVLELPPQNGGMRSASCGGYDKWTTI